MLWFEQVFVTNFLWKFEWGKLTPPLALNPVENAVFHYFGNFKGNCSKYLPFGALEISCTLMFIVFFKGFIWLLKTAKGSNQGPLGGFLPPFSRKA
ncbi:hypothetical protein TEU_02445 [Thermococcus eurythermalis]|uniref:Uncharacterized protein n=1 Tax=Thermococcus eurythermalis TaxID=1505907 RepID=A0A097QS41_9EURY|nr:hypothetical protein TEU_02445 [Thermococcus eurythermalis]